MKALPYLIKNSTISCKGNGRGSLEKRILMKKVWLLSKFLGASGSLEEFIAVGRLAVILNIQFPT